MSTLQQLQHALSLLSEAEQEKVLRYTQKLSPVVESSEPQRKDSSESLKRLMKFAGCLKSTEPHSFDDQDIDRDIAEEAASSHEDAK
ncbi:MAG: hypothetical protein QM703_06680 [Gemmatales bacterium]